MSSTLASADDLATPSHDTFEFDTIGQVGIVHPRSSEDEVPLAGEEEQEGNNAVLSSNTSSTKRNWKLPTTIFLALVALLAIGISVGLRNRNNNANNKGSIASIQKQQAKMKQQPPKKQQNPKNEAGIAADAPKDAPIKEAPPKKQQDPTKEGSIEEVEAPKVAPVNNNKPAKPPKKEDNNLNIATPYPTDQKVVTSSPVVVTTTATTAAPSLNIISSPTFYPTNQNTITVSTEVTAPPTVGRRRPVDDTPAPVIESPTWLG